MNTTVVEKLCDIGVSRERNEDNYIYLRCELDGKEVLIACVCDGMGGLDAGDYASKVVCESIRKEISSNEFSTIIELNRAVTLAIKHANREIYRSKTQHGTTSGTTVSCVVLYDGSGYGWHVGDSRVIRVQGNNIVRLTKDHTLANKKIEAGQLTESEALNHSSRNMLLRAIGVKKDVAIDTFNFTVKDALVVISTDGFWHYIKNTEYVRLHKKEISLNTLLTEVIKRGETDNITALALYTGGSLVDQ